MKKSHRKLMLILIHFIALPSTYKFDQGYFNTINDNKMQHRQSFCG